MASPIRRIDVLVELLDESRQRRLKEELCNPDKLKVAQKLELAKRQFARLSEVMSHLPEEKRQALTAAMLGELFTVAYSYIEIAHELAHQPRWQEAAEDFRRRDNGKRLCDLFADLFNCQWA